MKGTRTMEHSESKYLQYPNENNLNKSGRQKTKYTG